MEFLIWVCRLALSDAHLFCTPQNVCANTSIDSLHRMNEKCTVKPKEVNLSHNTGKKYCMNIRRPSELWFPIYGLLMIKQNFQCPPSVPMQALQETDFLDPTFFTHFWLGMFTTISYETSFQRYCKMWICRLEFIYDSCMMVLHNDSFLQFGSSWTTCFRNNG